MKTIEVYETEDGQRFDSEQEAIEHEKECVLVEWLRKKEGEYIEYSDSAYFTVENMFYFLKHNKTDLIRILSNLTN